MHSCKRSSITSVYYSYCYTHTLFVIKDLLFYYCSRWQLYFSFLSNRQSFPNRLFIFYADDTLLNQCLTRHSLERHDRGDGLFRIDNSVLPSVWCSQYLHVTIDSIVICCKNIIKHLVGELRDARDYCFMLFVLYKYSFV